MTNLELVIFKAGELAKDKTADDLRERIAQLHEQLASLEVELPLTHIALALVEGHQPNPYWINRPWATLP